MAVRDDFAAGEVLAAADLNDTFASKLDLAGGKILQIVRATDSSSRSTTSTSFTDASISITITPSLNTSAILLIANSAFFSGSTVGSARWQITDSSNNAITGAEDGILNDDAVSAMQTIVGYSTPATTSATTYKIRFRVDGSGTVFIRGDVNITQLYAIEVSA